MTELLYYDLKESPGLPHSLATHVAREIGRRIVAGALPAGKLINDEAALADRYQVSRSVVRDAVKILVGKGMLEVRRGIGTRVRARADWGLLDDDVLAWHQSAPPERRIVAQLMELRRLIEPRAARWAAKRGGDADLRAIAEAQERMERATASIEEFVTADALFHRSILRAADNEFLRALEGLIYSVLLGSIRLTNRDPRDNETSIPFHRAVADAICRRDPEAAERLMEELLADAAARLEG